MSKKERFNVLDKFIILGFVVLLLSVVVILLRTAHDTVSICGGAGSLEEENATTD